MNIKKRHLINSIIGIILMHIGANAQIQIFGRVYDSAGIAIPSVTVSLVHKDGLIIAFSVTDDKGKYSLSAKEVLGNDSIFISTMMPSYRVSAKKIKKDTKVIDFYLIPEAKYLTPVIVESKPAIVKIKNDTTEFNVSSFVNKNDRVIGDIIKKIPGIDVDEQGKISFQGREITKLYIDGDNLLNNKYNIATNNIPVDFVSKIQVLENNQDIRALKKTELSKDPALNLVLSDKAKLRLSGTGEIGVGLPSIYDVGIESFLFKKKLKFINLIKSNNAGDELKNDVVSHFSVPFIEPSLDPFVSITGNKPPLTDRRYLFNNSGLIDINALIKLKKESQITLNAHYLSNRSEQNSSHDQMLFLPNDTITYSESSHIINNKNPFQGNFSILSNSNDIYFNNSIQIDIIPNSISSSVMSNPGGVVQQLLDSRITKISNDFRIIRNFNDKYVLEGRSYFSSGNNPLDLTVRPSFFQSMFPNSIPVYGMNQNIKTPIIFNETYVALAKPGTIIQKYKIGYSAEYSNLYSNLSLISNNNEQIKISDSVNNSTRFSRSQIYFEPSLSFKNQKFTLESAFKINFRNINYGDAIVGIYNKQNYIDLLPMIYLKWIVGKEDNITFSSYFNNESGNVQNVYIHYILTNYKTLSSNSNILPEKLSQNFNISYNYRNTLKLFYFSLGFNFTENRNKTISFFDYSPFTIISKNIPYNNNTGTSVFFIFISKYIFSLFTTVSANISYSKSNTNQFQNQILLPYVNNVYGVLFKVNSKISDAVNLSYEGRVNYFENSQKNRILNQPDQTSINVYQKLDWIFNLKNQRCGLNFSCEHFYSNSDNTANNIFFLDLGGFVHSTNGKHNYSLSFNNLLNTKSYGNTFLNSNSIESNKFQIRPASVILKYQFRF